MKKVSFILSALAFMAFTQTSIAAPSTSPVSTKASSIVWNAKKVTGEHTGTIGISAGKLVVNKNQITGGNFTIDMKSIVCKDITDPEYNKKFVSHITSGDFFEIEKFPTAQFVITKVAGNQVSGNLTIKGITKAISFPAQISQNNGKMIAKANITIDRTDYNIKYGSKKFFESIGDKAIFDDFTLAVTLVSE
ncbi:YceI family protein [Aquirufa sp. Wall-65K1]